MPLCVPLGCSSENAAHRIAGEWTGADGTPHEGVYIPRRDSASLVNQLVGGRLFPGTHARASFRVREREGRRDMIVRRADRHADFRLVAHPAQALTGSSLCSSLEEASRFFAGGAVGYSPSSRGDGLEGLQLCTQDCRMAPLAVLHLEATYFADEPRFPRGTVAFDCALLMWDSAHQWRVVPRLEHGLSAREVQRAGWC